MWHDKTISLWRILKCLTQHPFSILICTTWISFIAAMPLLSSRLKHFTSILLKNRYKFILFSIIKSQVLNISRGPYHTGGVSSQNMTPLLSPGPCRWWPLLSLPSVSPPSLPLSQYRWSPSPAEVHPAAYPGEAGTLAPQTPVLHNAAALLQSQKVWTSGRHSQSSSETGHRIYHRPTLQRNTAGQTSYWAR